MCVFLRVCDGVLWCVGVRTSRLFLHVPSVSETVPGRRRSYPLLAQKEICPSNRIFK